MMETRIKNNEKLLNAMKSLLPLNLYLAKCTVEKHLLDLVCMRLSQVNRCAYCLDMHSKDLRAKGESEERLYALNAWQETPFFTERERAALAFAEGLNACRVPDELYEETSRHFTEDEIIDLTFGITAINTYNRINHVARPLVGTYQVGQWG